MWVDGELLESNLPEELYKSDNYKTSIVFKNTGRRTATFMVELASLNENIHIQASDEAEVLKSNDNIKKIASSNIQEFTLRAGKTQKAYFNIRPVVPAGEEIAPVFRLKTESSQLIEEQERGPYPVVNNIVGYVVDIIGPDSMIAGTDSMMEVRVRNSWNSGSNDYILTLLAPEFEVTNSERKLVTYPVSTVSETFRVNPYGGGDFTITAQLRRGESVDTLTKDIKVLGDKIYRITNVEAPSELRRGESTNVIVDVENKGYSSNTLALELDSNDFKIDNPSAILKLESGEKTKVIYSITPTREYGKLSFSVKLYDTPEKYQTSVYNKVGKLADSKFIYIDIDAPKQNTETEENNNEETETEENTETNEGENTETNVESGNEETENTESETTNNNQSTTTSGAYLASQFEGVWPVLVIILLIVVIVLLVKLTKAKNN